MTHNVSADVTSQKRKISTQDYKFTDQGPKAKKQRKSKTEINETSYVDQGINTAIGKMDGHLLADYIVQSTRRFGKNMSPVEFEDNHISGPVKVRSSLSGLALSLLRKSHL